MHPEGLPSALILDLSHRRGGPAFRPALRAGPVQHGREAIGDEIMAALDKLIAPSDDAEESD